MGKKYIKLLYWIFFVAGILVICAGIYLILRNLGVF